MLVDLFNLRSRQNFDAEFLKPPGGFPGQGFGERRQDTIAALEQNNRSLRGIDAAKVSTQRNGGHLRHRGCQLHAGGAAANQHESHQPGALAFVIGKLCQLVGAQDLGSDRLCIPQVLEPWRIPGKLVVAEIARLHPGSDDQEIECDLMGFRTPNRTR